MSSPFHDPFEERHANNYRAVLDKLAARAASLRHPHDSTKGSKGKPMKSHACIVCGFVYDETVGMPDEGFPAGTKGSDIPAHGECPDCGVGKADFEWVEVR